MACNLSQEILQTGIEQGMEKGMEKGIKEMALELYEMEMNISQIANAVKVSEEQIKAWIAECK